MFGFLRARVKFAGRLGWYDGRRGYPEEQHFVALPLHVSAPATAPGGAGACNQALPQLRTEPVAQGKSEHHPSLLN